jgi:hypothetical protein
LGYWQRLAKIRLPLENINLMEAIPVDEPDSSYTHFKGKDAIGHVAEAQAEGIIDSAEIHGTETPGHLSAAADAARDTAAVLTLALAVLQHTGQGSLGVLSILALGWIFWKTGRSAWLGWFRLERLHRILAQEKWEIEHHRQQERDELRVLYAAKGFEGKLLEDVLDVLMADGDRLLRVMVEEELGLRLQAYEHPLKQAFGAFIGALAATIVMLAAFAVYPAWGLLIGGLAVIGISASTSALQAKNAVIAAVIWNIGILAFAFGSVYFLLDTFYGLH